MAVRETLELDFSRPLADIAALDRRLQAAAVKFNAEVSGAFAKLQQGSGTGLADTERQLAATGAAAEDTAKKTGQYGEALDTVNEKAVKHTESLRAMSTQAVVTGTAILGAFGLAVKAATDLETSLAPVGTLLGTNTVAGKELNAALKDVIASSPQSADEIGASAYTILSAGISGTTNVLDTLRASQKLSEAGLGTLGEATNLVTSAVAVFGAEGLTANKAAQILFGTISLGKTTTAGLAEGFGQIAPLAASAGVSFHDLLAATAALTATGQTAAIAYTGLRGILTGILNPTKEAADAAERLGIDFSVAHLKSVGLATFLDEIKTKTGGSVENMTALFGSVEGLNSALTLTGPQAEQFAKNLAGIDDAGKNLNSRAKEIEDTVGNKLAAAFNSLKVSLAEAIQPVIPFIEKAAGLFRGFGESIAGLPEPTRIAGASLVALIGAGTLAFGAIVKIDQALLTASQRLREFGAEGSLVDRATTKLGDNLGLLARGATALLVFPILSQQLEQLTGDFASAGAAAGAMAGTLVLPGLGTAVGAAIGGIAGEIGLLGKESGLTAQEVRGLAGELDKLSAKQAGKAFFDALPQHEKLQIFSGDISSLRTEIKNLAGVDPTAASRVVQGLADSGLLTAAGIDKLRGSLQGGTQDFKDHAVAAKGATDANNALDPTIQNIGNSADTSADKIDNLKDALDAISGSSLSAEQADLAWVEALRTLNEHLDANSKSLDIGTEAGDKNRATLLDLTQKALDHSSAVFEQTGSLDQANGVLGEHITSLIDDATATGLNRDQVIAYVATILGIPPEKITDIQQDSDPEKALVQAYIDKVNETPGLKETTFVANTSQAMQDVQNLVGFLNSLGFNTGGGAVGLNIVAAQFQTGGPVPGPLGAPVPAIVHGGEYVLSADVVQAIKTGGTSEGLGGQVADTWSDLLASLDRAVALAQSVTQQINTSIAQATEILKTLGTLGGTLGEVATAGSGGAAGPAGAPPLTPTFGLVFTPSAWQGVTTFGANDQSPAAIFEDGSGITADAYQAKWGHPFAFFSGDQGLIPWPDWLMFHKGGLVPGLFGQPVPIMAQGGEFVLSADVVRAIRTGTATAGLAAQTGVFESGGKALANQPLIGTLVVQGETPNALKVARETTRLARARVFRGG